jgi:hypothetical protein
VAAGRTLEEARELAAEALGFHIQGMIEDGEAVPEPSSLDAVAERSEGKDAIVFLVSVPDPEPTYVRVNVTVPDAALREIDRFAERRGISRSQLFTESALAVAEGRVARGRLLPGRADSLYGGRGGPLKEKRSTSTRTGKPLAPRGGARLRLRAGDAPAPGFPAAGQDHQ